MDPEPIANATIFSGSGFDFAVCVLYLGLAQH
jgi:hypothetical protein